MSNSMSALQCFQTGDVHIIRYCGSDNDVVGDAYSLLNGKVGNNQYEAKIADGRIMAACDLCRTPNVGAKFIIAILFYPFVSDTGITENDLGSTFPGTELAGLYDYIVKIRRDAKDLTGRSNTGKKKIDSRIFADASIDALRRSLASCRADNNGCITEAFDKAVKLCRGDENGFLLTYIGDISAVIMTLIDSGVPSEIAAASVIYMLERKNDALDKVRNPDGYRSTHVTICSYASAAADVDKKIRKAEKVYDYFHTGGPAAAPEPGDDAADAGADISDTDDYTIDDAADEIKRSVSCVAGATIAAARIVHELSLADSLPDDRFIDKVRDVYRGLFDKLGLSYFVGLIDDIIFRAKEPTGYNNINNAYAGFLDESARDTADFRSYLSKCFEPSGDAFVLKAEDGGRILYTADMIDRLYSPQELLDMTHGGLNDTDKCAGMIRDKRVPVCEFDLIYACADPEAVTQDFVGALIGRLLPLLEQAHASVASLRTDEHGLVFLDIANRYHFHYSCCCCSLAEYSLRLLGNRDLLAGRPAAEDDGRPGRISIKYVDPEDKKIKTKRVPGGSTVLDVALLVNQIAGLSLLSAKITHNGTEMTARSVSFSTVVSDGDTLEWRFDTQTDNGYLEYNNIAKLIWLDYVNTGRAHRILMDHFQKAYEIRPEPAADEEVMTRAAGVRDAIGDGLAGVSDK